VSIIHVLKQAPSYWYLASPYSHSDGDVLQSRFAEAVRAAAWLSNLRVIAFSPIAHSHPMAVNHSLPGDWGFWKHFDEVFVAQSSGVIVLTIDGWRESKGVKAEIELARLQGLPVYWMQPEGDNYAFVGDIL
jgi:hypothetical protein